MEVALMEREVARRAQDHVLAEAGNEKAALRVSSEMPYEDLVMHVIKLQVPFDFRPDFLTAVGVTFRPDPKLVMPTSGWACPSHGYTILKTLTSRAGRVYRSCVAQDCGRYETAPDLAT